MYAATRSAVGAVAPIVLICAAGCSSGPGTASADQGTPAAAMTTWLKQVVRGDYHTLCQETAALASKTHGPTPYPTAQCVSTLTSLHGNFVIDGLTPHSSIAIGPVKADGDSATVDGTGIQVSGRTLTALMVAHSTGVKPGQLTISFQLTRVNGSWHVTGMNLNA